MNKALQAVITARERAESHISGNRDTVLTLEFDEQIKRFIDNLLKMEDSLKNNDTEQVTIGMSRVIADQWPFNSEIGNLICKAEEQFKIASNM